MLYYLVSDRELEEQFTALKNCGLLPLDRDFEHFKQVTLDIWPPGSPDPKKARPKDIQEG